MLDDLCPHRFRLKKTGVARPAEEMEVLATGYRGRQNSLIYFCPPSPSQHVVFFQGDMQVHTPMPEYVVRLIAQTHRTRWRT